jgi:hypothetical protein
MTTFETGLSTFAANDVALTVSNDGDVYRAFKASAPASQSAVIASACVKYGRRQYGLSFDSEALAECVTYVLDHWSQA